jgi:hypothetical protein
MCPQHLSSHFANQELNWAQTDSYEQYQKNLIEKRDELEQFGWIDQTFTYRYNSQGFRSAEFEESVPSAMFLGCSHTLGVGLPMEATFSHMVSTSLNLKNFNLGVPGSSNDTAFRLAHYYIPRLKPTIVVFLSTERTRFELFDQDNIQHILTFSNRNNSFKHVRDDVKGFYRHWIMNNNNIDMHYAKNVGAIQQLCSANNIKFYHREFLTFPLIDKARDLEHYGIKSNNIVAKKILENL